jgi:hypothetical protein
MCEPDFQFLDPIALIPRLDILVAFCVVEFFGSFHAIDDVVG